MVLFTQSFLSLLLLAVTLQVQAVPWPLHAKHATHRTRYLGKRQVKVESYHPPSTFKTWGEGQPLPSATLARSLTTISDRAKSYVHSVGVDPSAVHYQSGYTEPSGAEHAYLVQQINGIPVANAFSNVAMKGDKVLSYASSFIDVSKATIAPGTPTTSWRSVQSTIEETLDSKYNGINSTVEYLARADGSVSLVHAVEFENDATGALYRAYIDAHSGELLSVDDFTAHASYTVVPIERKDFSLGINTLNDPQDAVASPNGWHNIGFGDSTTTSGNNALAFKGQTASSETSEGLQFNARYDDTLAPDTPENVNAARINAFYIINVMHDFSFRYGFTEDAFNFQLKNLNGGNGGAEDDRVLVSVQDASGVNNAVFTTPPDGRSGVCRMFIWDTTSPNRDGAMSNDVLIHEMTHGITNRMIGGGRSNCLQTTESGGLGEGWGDAMADWMSQTSVDTKDFVLGSYVFAQGTGLRRFPYSTDESVNPLRYSSVANLANVHDIGEVWANMLHNVYASLVSELGFSETKLTTPDGPEGNIVFMRLFIASLPLMPCNPTFLNARDAWIEADSILYGGRNQCTLFRAFASRGLGFGASTAFVDDASVPTDC